MIQEEKDLLLKDLCARLPYGVKASFDNTVNAYDGNVSSVEVYTNVRGKTDYHINGVAIGWVKPYLFPMSSMTEGLKNEIHPISNIDINDVKPLVLKQYFSYFDWLNENHFDYHGLIERGLAIDATNLNIY